MEQKILQTDTWVIREVAVNADTGPYLDAIPKRSLPLCKTPAGKVLSHVKVKFPAGNSYDHYAVETELIQRYLTGNTNVLELN